MAIRIDQLEQIVRRYLATGTAAVVVVLAPATGAPAATDTGPASGATTTVTVAPDSPAPPRSGSTGPPNETTPSTARSVDGSTTAAALGWGEPVRADEFDAGTGQWSIYDGPGHAGEGRRSPSAVSVRDGVLTITGDRSGTTAGMSWGDGRRYGRWEARVRAPAGDPSYNALLLLWPDAENWPEGGEIDFMEIGDPDRQEVDVFLHYGEDNEQKHGRVETDATRWHNWAVEWTPTSITTFLDGRKWYGTTDRVVQPPGPMHLCIQLDWFPSGSDTVQESTMEVDWVREYDLDAVENG
jgi:Glycosyl hydrolases family 16